MGRRTKLTPEVQEIIVNAIRKGAFDWVAAEAAGIHPQTFRNWMRWGEKGNKRYLSFFEGVRRARADARMDAEARVFGDNAFNWLRYGPGRERPGEPGWTAETRVRLLSGEELVSAIEDELARVAGSAPAPDAREAEGDADGP